MDITSVVDDQLTGQTGHMFNAPVGSDDEIQENQGLGLVSSTQKIDASGDPVTTQSGV